MLINTNLASDTSPVALQQKRAETSAASTQALSTLEADSSNPLDPSLQRLTETPSSIQDAAWAIQDEAGASQVMENLRQSMLGQPEMAMAAQGNQLSGNVLSLLQPID
jgi:hypothetical protein